jgi:hypothetical protein
LEEREWNWRIALKWPLGYCGVIMGGGSKRSRYFLAVGFSIRIFQDLASVLGSFNISFIVTALEVFRLTLLNKPITIKLTQGDESLEDKSYRKLDRRRQLLHKVFFVLYIGLLYIVLCKVYYL